MGKPGRIISIIIIVVFGAALMEGIAFLFHIHTFLSAQIAIGLLVVIFLAGAYSGLKNRNNVIRLHQKRERHYPWFWFQWPR